MIESLAGKVEKEEVKRLARKWINRHWVRTMILFVAGIIAFMGTVDPRDKRT